MHHRTSHRNVRSTQNTHMQSKINLLVRDNNLRNDVAHEKSAGLTIRKRFRRKLKLSHGKIIRIFFFAGSLLLSLAGRARLARAAVSETATIAASTGRMGIQNLIAAALMISTFGGAALFRMGLPTMARTLMVAASRCALQLFLLGSVVLHRLMSASNPILVCGWILGVGFVAAREAFSRVQYVYPKMRRHVYSSVICGTLSVLTIALLAVFQLDPWYQPRTMIPVAGMLFGNTLSAAALGASEITRQFAVNRHAVELRLARGATATEASLPLIQQALLTALTPTINGLAVTGIVHIPGMMTGSLLAGFSPQNAALHQMAINLLIATTACITVQLLVTGASSNLVDFRQHRIRDALKDKDNTDSGKSFPEKVSSFVGLAPRNVEESMPSSTPTNQDESSGVIKEVSFRKLVQSNTTDLGAVLEIKDLHVSRTKLDLSFSLDKGERLGITGASGIGKSQILRSMVGFEGIDGESITISGQVPGEHILWPRFRTKVCFVPQERPNLEGTPRLFFASLSKFQTMKTRENNGSALPWDISKDWNLPDGIWDRPWASLSGGEAQRISLAIALSTDPEVLLLDESLNALDDSTCRIVEDSLKESGVAIVMVTHSKYQLERFCTKEASIE